MMAARTSPTGKTAISVRVTSRVTVSNWGRHLGLESTGGRPLVLLHLEGWGGGLRWSRDLCGVSRPDFCLDTLCLLTQN